MLEGVFAKGDITLFIDGQNSLHFKDFDISLFGVAGLPWGNLKVDNHFGQIALTEISFKLPETPKIKTSALILKESTAKAIYMVLKFNLEPDAHEKLGAYIQKHGYHPADHTRKYPRIPSTHLIQTFPLYAVARIVLGEPGHLQESMIVFNVENLSPNGILISTESSVASTIRPGHKLHLTLDTRGWFPFQIHFQAIVCRIMDDIHKESKNITRRMGMKFSDIDEINQAAFLSLLNTILEELKRK